MNDCLFCKIIAREIPSSPVYEDEDVYAFLDIHPVNPGHALVVPKKHCSGFLDCDASVLPKWIMATQKIAQAMKRALNLEGLNLEQNEGRIAGQLIPHLHVHIVPRHADDGLRHWPGKTYATIDEQNALAEKIPKGDAMTMLKEVEVKARISDPQDVIARLEALGCKLGDVIEQRDRIFLKNGVDYDQVGMGTIFLRIRKQGDKTVFTFKQRMANELECLERELVVSDGNAMAEILPRLDFYEVVQVNKRRRKGSARGYVFCLDEVEGLGTFLEIEKMVEEHIDGLAVQEELIGVLAELGIKEADRTEHGYDTLMYRKQKGT